MQELWAIAGIAVGVALLFASQVTTTSLTHSFADLVSQITGHNPGELQLEARGPDGFSERLLGEIQSQPGVRLTLPLIEAQAEVVGPGGSQSVDLIGADPRFARAAGPLLRRYSAKQLVSENALALPAPLAARIGVSPLEVFSVAIGARVMSALLATTLGEADVGALIHSPLVLTNIRYAQQLTGRRHRLTRVFVLPKPGQGAKVSEELTRLASGAPATVEPADYDATLFAVASEPPRRAELLFSILAALVAFLFALNAMLVTVPARRRLIADLRGQGATTVMTSQIALFDAAIIGCLGCGIGLALGDALSIVAFSSTPDYLSFAFPVGNERIVTATSLFLAVTAGAAAAVIGVLWPLRDVLAGGVTSDRAAAAKGCRRQSVVPAIAGTVLLAVTTVILFDVPSLAVIGSVALVGALLCLLPYLFDAMVGALSGIQRRWGGAATQLTITELMTPRTRIRSLAIAATAAVAVFGLVEFGGAQSNLQHGLDESAREIDSNGQIWVAPTGEANTFATTPFRSDPSVLAGTPGVAAVGIYRGGFLNWGKRRLWIVAPPASAPEPVPSGQIRRGSAAIAEARLRQGGWAVLSEALAREHHLGIGQQFVLPSPVLTRLRVAAISTNLAWPSGAVVLSSETYARAWGSNDASAYQVSLSPGTSALTVSQVVRRKLAAYPGLAVETVTQRERRHFASSRAGLSRLTEIRLLLLIAAILAVAGATAAMVWQRRDLVAFMRCDGYPRGVLWRWLCLENACLIVVGAGSGAVLGLYGQVLATHFTATVTGFPVVYGSQLLTALLTAAVLSIVAVVMVALPGYLVARTAPRVASPAY